MKVEIQSLIYNHNMILILIVITFLIISYTIVICIRIPTITKVAIVGSGISGLSAASCIKNINSDVKEIDIYESRKDIIQKDVGGGLMLSGGLVVLHQIGLFEQLQSIGSPSNEILSRTSNGEVLLKINQNELINAHSIFESNDERGHILESNKSYPFYGIMRSSLQSLLYNDVKSNSNKDIKINLYSSKKCKWIEESIDKTKASIVFEDNSISNEYDLVIGADGIRSSIRDYIISDNMNIIDKLFPFLHDRRNRYTGLRISYVISDIDSDNSIRPYRNNHQWFGIGCYVFIATCGSEEGLRHILYVCYQDDDNPNLGENWLVPSKEEKEIQRKYYERLGIKELSPMDKKNVIHQRLINSGLNESTEIMKIFKHSNDSKILDLGIRDRMIPLHKWFSKSGRVVLIGDAAHPMSPFLGQGANQGLQDAYSVALAIKMTNKQEINEKSLAIKDLMNDYERLRKPFITAVAVTSAIFGYIDTMKGTFGQLIRNNFLKFLHYSKLGEKIIEEASKPRF